MASSLHGKFVWYELTSPDAAASRRFFAEVLGWQTREGSVPGLDYSLESAAGTDIAGIMGQQEGMPAAWLGYLCVDNVDEAFAKAIAAGALPIVPVNPIPGVGRFCILLDPTRAPIGFLEYSDEFPKPGIRDQAQPGHGWWRELHTGDREKAFAFYQGLFGWADIHHMPMGPEEFYQVIGYDPAQGRGAIFTDRDAKSPYWLYYFWVEDLDAAQGRLERAGGKVFNGPMEVPDSTWIIHASDPQGITFALVGYRGKK